MSIIFARVSIAVINIHDQKQLGENELLLFILPQLCPLSRKSGQNSRPETGAEAIEERLALHGLLRQLSYISRNYLPNDGTTHSELGPPTSIIN